MNQKIREFAEQSGSTHKQSLGVYQFYSDELEKFAELIIRDVLSNVWDEVQYSTSYEIDYSTSQDIANEIDEKLKKYYGIE